MNEDENESCMEFLRDMELVQRNLVVVSSPKLAKKVLQMQGVAFGLLVLLLTMGSVVVMMTMRLWKVDESFAKTCNKRQKPRIQG
ncbi:hypothetical protein VIGAN_07229500 [Vigna angularis var. angularis]|uniref:Uncharacterized protein n=1 Tax=Vigna angularis var. angularis TaxID=157739 RepID=A0A0S3SKG2_PHAAN|nr:hypothetical protein VIGAN_07229500 [Vigna angularis var. angularis]